MSSSRLIIKNLPKTTTEKQLRDLFCKQGTITDVQLKFTQDGKFRQFAFIGFENKLQADTAISYHNNTYIGTSKVSVLACSKLGDPNKPKSWKKTGTSEKDSAKRKQDIITTSKPKIRRKEDDILEKCEKDPQFLEFLEVHKKKSPWANDSILDKLKLSDPICSKNNDEEKKLDGDNVEDDKPKKSIKAKETKKESVKKKRRQKKNKDKIDQFTLKLRNLPEKANLDDIKLFFSPLIPKTIRQPLRGIAYVGFKNENDYKVGLKKDKSFLQGNRVSVRMYTNKRKMKENIDDKKTQWVKQHEELEKEAESVGESGRIFIRNLSYTTTEEDIRQLFEKFGPVTEVHLPIDSVSRCIKGFGFISFLLPEHATLAFNELDGSIFKGRMLHLLPSKTKNELIIHEKNLSSFKKSKLADIKKSSGSSHNWNSLFISQSALAQVMSAKYGISREELLLDKNEENNAKKHLGVGVTMALGETEIVDETRKFLEENDVCLEAFENQKCERSKTVMLVKNLPANTKVDELVALFSVHGKLGRILLPKTGLTAIVEFYDSAEARAAFKKLAYTKFSGVPLFLEWAPQNTFRSVRTEDANSVKNSHEKLQKAEEVQAVNQPNEINKSEEEEAIPFDLIPESDTTLFVKNLNFSTSEQALKNHFKQCGQVYSVTIANKKDSKQPDKILSMGYGFVQFYKAKDTIDALKTLQGSMLDNHLLELKKSTRLLQGERPRLLRDSVKSDDIISSKILVRNIPFQATLDEIKNLFLTFGEIRACRLPMKLDGSQSHRGFAFVEFVHHEMAKKAFEILSKSTHLYGRRLVLEWANHDESVQDLRKKTAKKFELQKTKSDINSTKKAISRYFTSQSNEKKSESEDSDN